MRRTATNGQEVHAGDPRDVAIPKLMRTCGDRIFGLAMGMCRDRQLAEDIAQETFLQAWRKWDQFDGRSAPSTWLYTIASRICRRKLRKRSGEPKRIARMSELLPFRESGVPDLPDVNHDSPLERQYLRERREIIEQVISQLPENFRLPLVLREILELSTRETADILGIREATVKTRLHRARLALRKAMLEDADFRPAPDPAYSKQMCMDFLRAKMEALDRGVPFSAQPEIICERCQSVFRSLDMTQQVCAQLRSGDMPEALRQAVLQQFESR